MTPAHHQSHFPAQGRTGRTPLLYFPVIKASSHSLDLTAVHKGRLSQQPLFRTTHTHTKSDLNSDQIFILVIPHNDLNEATAYALNIRETHYSCKHARLIDCTLTRQAISRHILKLVKTHRTHSTSQFTTKARLSVKHQTCFPYLGSCRTPNILMGNNRTRGLLITTSMLSTSVLANYTHTLANT